MDTFSKGDFPRTLVAIINNHEKASEPAGWALSIVVLLSKDARSNRKYENISRELIDHNVCEAIHNALATSKDDFVKENCEEAKKNLMRLDQGKEAFAKLG